MELLICILKDYRCVEGILLGFLELGVTGATVLEGRGMAQIVGSDHPLFASVRGLFPGSAHESQVIISVIGPGQSGPVFALIEKVTGGLDAAGRGIAFTVPITNARGLAPEID